MNIFLHALRCLRAAFRMCRERGAFWDLSAIVQKPRGGRVRRGTGEGGRRRRRKECGQGRVGGCPILPGVSGRTDARERTERGGIGVFEIRFSIYVVKTTEFGCVRRRMVREKPKAARKRVFSRFGFQFTLFFQRNSIPRRRVRQSGGTQYAQRGGNEMPRRVTVRYIPCERTEESAAARARSALFPRIALLKQRNSKLIPPKYPYGAAVGFTRCRRVFGPSPMQDKRNHRMKRKTARRISGKKSAVRRTTEGIMAGRTKKAPCGRGKPNTARNGKRHARCVV